LAADCIQVPALHLAEPRDGFPDSCARSHHDGVLGLPEADEQRRRGGIMFDDRSKILIECGLETSPVAVIRSGEKREARGRD